MDAVALGSKGRSDYGGLKLGKLKGEPREISDSAYLLKSKFHHPDQARDDDGNDAYTAFDDDFIRGTEGTLVSYRIARPLQQISTLRDQNGLTTNYSVPLPLECANGTNLSPNQLSPRQLSKLQFNFRVGLDRQ